jgi:hypothetical protein
MLCSAVILIVSAALFLFYAQATCQKALRREFDGQYFESIVNAYRLEFPTVVKSIQQADGPFNSEAARQSLRADFQTLSYLMRSAVQSGPSPQERLLAFYFKSILFSLGIRQALGLGGSKPAAKLAAILQYFSNVLGEQVNPLRYAALTPSDGSTPC